MTVYSISGVLQLEVLKHDDPVLFDTQGWFFTVWGNSGSTPLAHRDGYKNKVEAHNAGRCEALYVLQKAVAKETGRQVKEETK